MLGMRRKRVDMNKREQQFHEAYQRWKIAKRDHPELNHDGQKPDPKTFKVKPMVADALMRRIDNEFARKT